MLQKFSFFVGALVSVALFAPNSTGQTKAAKPDHVPPPLSRSRQILLVTAKDWSATSGTARIFERRTLKSKWRPIGEAFSVVFGRSGLAPADTDISDAIDLKKEGDGRSPAGAFPLTFAFGVAEKPPGRLKYLKIDEFTECVDDPASAHYNRIVNRLQVGNFDWISSEKMADVLPEYDLGVFVGYNYSPTLKARGSCIFLHIWRDPETPTAGCTAMSRTDLEKVLRLLDPAKNPYLVQLPETEIRKFVRKWSIPQVK